MTRFFLWGGSIAVFAFGIRVGRPQDHFAVVAALVNSEVFHVVAHSFLYGVLAWLGTRRLARAPAFGLVVGMGLVQELAQVLGRRPFGAPELYDLGVDAVAAAVVVAVAGGRRA